MAELPPDSDPSIRPPLVVRKAQGEEPLFKVGDPVTISVRYPVGHYRVPRYVRGHKGVVDSLLTPKAVNNETEGFGQNAGCKGQYYRIALPLVELWPGYSGSATDNLRIEVFETWLEKRSS